MFGVMQTLSVVVCKDSGDAIRQGHIYNAADFQRVTVERAVVVQDGTDAGNPTIDFVLADQNGQKYVFMITAALLRSLPL
jgi:hypothetical protein